MLVKNDGGEGRRGDQVGAHFGSGGSSWQTCTAWAFLQHMYKSRQISFPERPTLRGSTGFCDKGRQVRESVQEV